MNKLKRTVLCVLFAVLGQIVFTGCHTANGFGQDMQDAGQSIQEKTDK